jgi:murein DD-endopeptidase MepM/ murein hydrolase activator NlpD
VILLALGGCATVPEGPWTEATAIPVATLEQARQEPAGSYHQVQRGETLWRIARSYGVDVHAISSVNRLTNTDRLAVGQRLFIPWPAETERFLWPVRGTVKRFQASGGVEISAAPGTVVRASRRGVVAVAAQHLPGLGTMVVLDHLDGHLSVYAGMATLLVSPGMAVRQGEPVGHLNARALHFEIRYGTVPKDSLALLP